MDSTYSVVSRDDWDDGWIGSNTLLSHFTTSADGSEKKQTMKALLAEMAHSIRTNNSNNLLARHCLYFVSLLKNNVLCTHAMRFHLMIIYRNRKSEEI